MSPHLVLLHAIGLLHRRGWEWVRVLPYVGGPGAWRCEVHVSDRGERFESDNALLLYTSAAENDFFSEGRSQEWSVSELTDRMQGTLRDRDMVRASDPEYAEWFFGLLTVCGSGGYPIAFDDSQSWQDEGVLAIRFYGAFPVPTATYPLAPGWEASVGRDPERRA